MIYIKIYLDKDENGENMLVFNSVKHDDKKAFFSVAGEKEKFTLGGRSYPWFDYTTKVIGVEQVAISPEAKELFIEMLNDENLCKYNMHFVDFELRGYSLGQYGWNTGIFSFDFHQQAGMTQYGFHQQICRGLLWQDAGILIV